MPIYTYLCRDCGERFDLLVGVTSKEEEFRCAKCGGRNLEKVLAPFAVNTNSGGSVDSSNLSCPTGVCSLNR